MEVIAPARAGFDEARLNRIAGWMQSYIDRRRYPGCGVLIARDGREVFSHFCGQRDIEADQPFTRDTVARIYSMTKPVTAVAVMTLVERGLFPLNAPVSDFIPKFGDMQALIPEAERLDQVEPCATPTLHQLLTHTSGLTYSFNEGPVPEAMREPNLDFGPGTGSIEEIANQLAQLPLVFAPSTRWEYSVAMDIVGRIVEVASGKTLDVFFQEEILGPLGMDETAFRVPKEAAERFAALYTPLDGNAMDLNTGTKGADTLKLADAPDGSAYHSTQTYSGGGGLVGTIDDYMAFTEMLRRGGVGNGARILSPKTVDFMMQNHLPGDIASMGPRSFAEQPMEGTGFGIGGSVVLAPGVSRTPSSVGDYAWGGMASTGFWIDRAHDVSVVFFTQLSPSSSYPSRSELRALMRGALMS